MSEEATTKIGVNNELMRERKRWGFFGIPWTFTKYILTEKKIIIERGLLRSTETSVNSRIPCPMLWKKTGYA